MAHFDLDDSSSYPLWRQKKLKWASDKSLSQPVKLGGETLSSEEKDRITSCLSKQGFCLYRLPQGMVASKQWIIQFGQAFGLNRLNSNLCADPDSISTIAVKSATTDKRYIPYTNHPINWHTDGYYNPPEQRINAFILHCDSPAAQGGENALLDSELAYIALRDKDPRFITALSHPETMCIPPNQENGAEVRGWECGPVFSIDADTSRLHMRYTARSRSIRWRDDTTTLAAVAFLQNLLTIGENGIVRHRLESGEGIICNNSLHARAGFSDSDRQQRLYYRARYFDSIDCVT